MPAVSELYDTNGSHDVLTGMLAALRSTQGRGVKLTPVQSGFLEHFGAIDKAAREGGQLPDAWHAQPGMQTDHPHMTVLVCEGDRVISEANRNILKVKCGELRSALEAWKQLKAEGDSPRAEREELERAAGEAENVAKHLQILGVVDGLFEGWEI
ncbi:hypothetical protein ACIF9R_12590 [Streptomyces sp. NPDC086080]|uniref:hypothetical protein n=1 Tax=Streptomyces sp. NPDC086080 TaxID=3365748 RepID=UPI0037D94046